MQITVQTDYAFRVLMYLQERHGTRIQTKEISEFYRISRNHLVKVVNKLTNLGYIESIKGRYHGGIQLCVNPRKINIGKVFCEFETNMAIVECFSTKKNSCRATSHCGLIKIFSTARKAFVDEFKNYTLHDLKGSTLLPQKPPSK